VPRALTRRRLRPLPGLRVVVFDAPQVRTSGHVLLLNWNSQSPAILRQIAAAQVRSPPRPAF
jgi:hypothetical protein